jgi:pimeloyl-ACP methyl ester carboxylesterase
MYRLLLTIIIAVCVWQGSLCCDAEPPEKQEKQRQPAEKKPPDSPGNVSSPTLGGVQFWADVLVFHDWRIQRNVYTGHHRLLDERDVRRAWGTFDHCLSTLDDLKRTLDLPPLSRKVVLTVHGLVRTRNSMEPLGEYISERSEYQVLHVGYPSTRADLATHAAGLASVIKHLEGVEEINFVGNSLGNLVIRRYLGDHTDPRIKRFVMIGPPNNGAQLAVFFKDNPLLGLVWGQSAKELATDWEKVSRKLAVPECEFGIIAGVKGVNPLVPGDDDLVVGVEETRLAGARDFCIVPVAHSDLRTDRKICECTLRFLEQGCFVSESERQPIKAETARRATQP